MRSPCTWPRCVSARLRLMLACMSAGEEPSASGGLGDSITRLVLRLVLLYLQQAPVPRARDCVQQALFLLPNLLVTHDTLSRYHQVHAAYPFPFPFQYLLETPVSSACVILALMPAAWRSLHACLCFCSCLQVKLDWCELENDQGMQLPLQQSCQESAFAHWDDGKALTFSTR